MHLKCFKMMRNSSSVENRGTNLVVWMVVVIILTHASVTCATCLMRRVVKLQRKSRKARGQGG